MSKSGYGSAFKDGRQKSKANSRKASPEDDCTIGPRASFRPILPDISARHFRTWDQIIAATTCRNAILEKARPIDHRSLSEQELRRGRNHRAILSTASSVRDPPLERNTASLPQRIEQENDSIDEGLTRPRFKPQISICDGTAAITLRYGTNT